MNDAGFVNAALSVLRAELDLLAVLEPILMVGLSVLAAVVVFGVSRLCVGERAPRVVYEGSPRGPGGHK